MSATFVNSLRAQDGVISIGESAAGNVLRFRVQAQEVWNVVRIDARPMESVRTAKMYALNALIPDALFPDEFSVKLNGCEIFDESISLSQAGVLDGSTLLVARRRRRPVKS
jgi:hypothetical protein